MRHARPILIAVVIGICACLTAAIMRSAAPASRVGHSGDLALYRAIAGRIRAGEPYYAVAHDELVARHYGVRSVLNWRPPTLARLVAAVPSPDYAKGILVSLAAGTLLVALVSVKRKGGMAMGCVVAVWLAGELAPAVLGETYLFSEAWAGILVLLSILIYARLPLVATVLAVAVVFLRELAVPYVVVLAAIACYDVRRAAGPRTRNVTVVVVLLAGLVAYGAFFLWHARQVKLHTLPSDPGYPTGWVQFGGLPFVLSAMRQNAWLLCLPRWAVALYLPVAVLGLFAWPAPVGRLARPVCLGYLTMFAVVGKPFNDYWGLLVTPTLGVAFCFGLQALVIAIRSAIGSPFDRAGREAGDEVLLECEE